MPGTASPAAIQLTPNIIPNPPASNQCTIAIQVINNANPVINYPLQFVLFAAPPGSGYLMADPPAPYNSNGSGFVYATCYQGAQYNILDGNSGKLLTTFTAPNTSTGNLPNLIV